MKIIVVKDYEEMSAKCAEIFINQLKNKPNSTLGLATGGSPVGTYKKIVEAYNNGEFGYDLSRTCDEIRPTYRHAESCQETVPEAVTAFLEGNSFEDVIRTAVSLGGDCDTLTAIAGSNI